MSIFIVTVHVSSFSWRVYFCVCLYSYLYTVYAVVVGIKAAAASFHTAEDSGTKTGLPGLYDHYDLHAA